MNNYNLTDYASADIILYNSLITQLKLCNTKKNKFINYHNQNFKFLQNKT